MTYIYLALATGVVIGFLLGLLQSKQTYKRALELYQHAIVKEDIVTKGMLVLKEYHDFRKGVAKGEQQDTEET